MFLPRSSARWLSLCLLLLTTAHCRRKHIRVDSVPEIPYPSCGNTPLPEGTITAQGTLRSGSTSLSNRQVVERFSVSRRDCLIVASGRQEWSLGISDYEVVFDANNRPLRAWKRMTVAGGRNRNGNADIRRYELRTPEVTIKHRTPSGAIEYEILRGGIPTAVIGPGRGLLTVWIQRANLAVGANIREVVLDFREVLEVIRPVTLQREPDQFDPVLHRQVRVYTIYGREPILTDENNVVIGDLAGLRPAQSLPGPLPAPMPSFGEPDPVHTP